MINLWKFFCAEKGGNGMFGIVTYLFAAASACFTNIITWVPTIVISYLIIRKLEDGRRK